MIVASRPGQGGGYSSRSSSSSTKPKTTTTTTTKPTTSTQPTQASQQAKAQAYLQTLAAKGQYVSSTQQPIFRTAYQQSSRSTPSSTTTVKSTIPTTSSTVYTASGTPASSSGVKEIRMSEQEIIAKDKTLYPTSSGGAMSKDVTGMDFTLTPPGVTPMGRVKFATEDMETTKETVERETAAGLAKVFQGQDVKWSTKQPEGKYAPAHDYTLKDGVANKIATHEENIRAAYADVDRGIEVAGQRYYGSAAAAKLLELEKQGTVKLDLTGSIIQNRVPYQPTYRERSEEGTVFVTGEKSEKVKGLESPIIEQSLYFGSEGVSREEYDKMLGVGEAIIPQREGMLTKGSMKGTPTGIYYDKFKVFDYDPYKLPTSFTITTATTAETAYRKPEEISTTATTTMTESSTNRMAKMGLLDVGAPKEVKEISEDIYPDIGWSEEVPVGKGFQRIYDPLANIYGLPTIEEQYSTRRLFEQQRALRIDQGMNVTEADTLRNEALRKYTDYFEIKPEQPIDHMNEGLYDRLMRADLPYVDIEMGTKQREMLAAGTIVSTVALSGGTVLLPVVGLGLFGATQNAITEVTGSPMIGMIGAAAITHSAGKIYNERYKPYTAKDIANMRAGYKSKVTMVGKGDRVVLTDEARAGESFTRAAIKDSKNYLRYGRLEVKLGAFEDAAKNLQAYKGKMTLGLPELKKGFTQRIQERVRYPFDTGKAPSYFKFLEKPKQPLPPVVRELTTGSLKASEVPIPSTVKSVAIPGKVRAEYKLTAELESDLAKRGMMTSRIAPEGRELYAPTSGDIAQSTATVVEPARTQQILDVKAKKIIQRADAYALDIQPPVIKTGVIATLKNKIMPFEYGKSPFLLDWFEKAKQEVKYKMRVGESTKISTAITKGEGTFGTKLPKGSRSFGDIRDTAVSNRFIGDITTRNVVDLVKKESKSISGVGNKDMKFGEARPKMKYGTGKDISRVHDISELELGGKRASKLLEDAGIIGRPSKSLLSSGEGIDIIRTSRNNMIDIAQDTSRTISVIKGTTQEAEAAAIVQKAVKEAKYGRPEPLPKRGQYALREDWIKKGKSRPSKYTGVESVVTPSGRIEGDVGHFGKSISTKRDLPWSNLNKVPERTYYIDKEGVARIGEGKFLKPKETLLDKYKERPVPDQRFIRKATRGIWEGRGIKLENTLPKKGVEPHSVVEGDSLLTIKTRQIGGIEPSKVDRGYAGKMEAKRYFDKKPYRTLEPKAPSEPKAITPSGSKTPVPVGEGQILEQEIKSQLKLEKYQPREAGAINEQLQSAQKYVDAHAESIVQQKVSARQGNVVYRATVPIFRTQSRYKTDMEVIQELRARNQPQLYEEEEGVFLRTPLKTISRQSLQESSRRVSDTLRREEMTSSRLIGRTNVEQLARVGSTTPRETFRFTPRLTNIEKQIIGQKPRQMLEPRYGRVPITRTYQEVKQAVTQKQAQMIRNVPEARLATKMKVTPHPIITNPRVPWGGGGGDIFKQPELPKGVDTRTYKKLKSKEWKVRNPFGELFSGEVDRRLNRLLRGGEVFTTKKKKAHKRRKK